MLITIIAFLIILALLVLVHEAGHFITAKIRGVKVLEFGLGFPPRIYAIQRGETAYSINALPLGGFVKLAGEEDPHVPRSLASKGYGTRLLVLAAGSLMNLLLPFILYAIAFMLPHDVVMSDVIINTISPLNPAAIAGMQPGDKVISVNGDLVSNVNDYLREVQTNLGNQITVQVLHPGSTTPADVRFAPRWKPPKGEESIITLKSQNVTITSQSLPLWEAVPNGAKECVQIMVLYKNEIVRWIIGASTPQLTGPVGMAEMTGEVVKAGISPLIQFAAFISISLGIINILPLPSLDGGRLAFVLLEIVRRGKRVSPRVEGLVHLIGFALLITLMIAITYNDIFNLVTSGSALPPG